MAPLLLFFLLSCSTFCHSLALLCSPQQDAAALIAFKNAILLDPLQILSTWNNSTLANCTSNTSITHPCSWSGVRCHLHRVVALQLSASQLTGTLSSSLGLLPFLRSLNLSSNRLSGGIPPELGMSTSLTSLDLSDNQLSGGIPAELGELSQLRFLALYTNGLSGGVPAALGNCTDLRQLALGSNNLSGSIPAELGVLHKLKVLTLWGNELSGGVPAALRNCTGLVQIDFNSNKLSGSIPARLGVLSKLEHLHLWTNELSGGVPAALGNCTNLVQLDLNLNKLSGSIPAGLGVLYKLEHLYLWGNELSGGVPAALGNCTSLTHLELALNSFSGSIPARLGLLNKVEHLYLWGNELSGGVPAALGNCTSLTHVDLSQNNLSGSIRTELGRLNKLTFLNLGSNLFTGRLPTTLTNCTNLTLLDVSGNQLSGPINDEFCLSWTLMGVLSLNDNLFSSRLPSCLSRLEKLSQVYLETNAFLGTIPPFSNLALNYLDVSTNNLSGSIPESFGALNGIVTLDLSHNLLSGHIPSSLGSMQQLIALNLSKNALSGSIPSAVGSCVELSTLNLSHNMLTGNVPSSFVSLKSLTKLDLSDNQLAGPLPNTWPYNDTRVALLSGNPLLCGEILKRTCNTSLPKSLQRASSNMKRIISLVISIIAAVVLILGLVIWRRRNHVECLNTIKYDDRPRHCLGRKAIGISREELQEATDSFSEANILGEGGASIVYKAVLVDGMTVAIKVLKMGMITGAEVARLKREVELLAMVRHRNIVRVLGCCFNLELQAIVLEFVSNGNLDRYLHCMERKDAITKEEKLRLLRGIAQGLEYLHHWHDPRKRIVHCDVKPANILLDEQWEPLIADFGIAKLLQEGKDMTEQSASLSILLRGSIGYIPPEYAFAAQVSCAGDVYSFGVVMLEILTGRRPMEVGGEQETLMSLVQDAYPEGLLRLFETPGMTSNESTELAKLGLSCTSSVPSERPTMLQVARALNAIANLPSDPHPYPTKNSWLDSKEVHS